MDQQGKERNPCRTERTSNQSGTQNFTSPPKTVGAGQRPPEATTPAAVRPGEYRWRPVRRAANRRGMELWLRPAAPPHADGLSSPGGTLSGMSWAARLDRRSKALCLRADEVLDGNCCGCPGPMVYPQVRGLNSQSLFLPLRVGAAFPASSCCNAAGRLVESVDRAVDIAVDNFVDYFRGRDAALH